MTIGRHAPPRRSGRARARTSAAGKRARAACALSTLALALPALLALAGAAYAEGPSIAIAGLPKTMHLNKYGRGENVPVTVSGETGPGGIAPYFFFIYGGSSLTPCAKNVLEQGYEHESFVDAIAFKVNGAYSAIEQTGGPIDIPGTYYFCAYLQNASVPQSTPPAAFAQKTFRVLAHAFAPLTKHKRKHRRHKRHRPATGHG